MTNKNHSNKSLPLLLISLVFCARLQAQNASTIDSTKLYLDKLIASSSPEDRASLNHQLNKLASSNKESDLELAAQYFYLSKNAIAGDSVRQLELKRFPMGTEARYAEQNTIYDEKTGASMETAYLKWIAKFPPEKFQTPSMDDKLIYDYARSAIASKYAEERNITKAIAYINMLETDFWMGSAYLGLSQAFYKNYDLPNAEIYARKAVENAASYTEGKKGVSNAALFAASGYNGACSFYANILYEEKKYQEALVYTKQSYQNEKNLNPAINERYADILIATKRYQEAFDKLDEVLKAGKASSEIIEKLKTVYIKLKGSDNGFDEYTRVLQVSALESFKAQLIKNMVKEPAAIFNLTDLEGHQVSLKDFRGKIVVLDFWATWCAPCKASFPAMQMAVNKYKNDPDVTFLFIHTWENSASATQDAKNFIESKKYTFRVLMDLKDQQTKENKVVSSYNVSGIPAKFVIDAGGNIRFKLTGFDGSNEVAVEELSMMIDMAKKAGI